MAPAGCVHVPPAGSPRGLFPSLGISRTVLCVATLSPSHALIPRTCEHVTLHGKRGFVGVTKLRASGSGVILCCSGGRPVATRILIEEEAMGSTSESGGVRADGGVPWRWRRGRRARERSPQKRQEGDSALDPSESLVALPAP